MNLRVANCPVFVSALPSAVDGIEPLGIGSVNEAMIAQALPGITNGTDYLRPYAAMAWLVWTFSQNMEVSGLKWSKERAKEFKVFREKVEILFTLGNRDFGGAVGKSRQKFLPEGRKQFVASFEELGSVAASWLVPAQYGSSMGVGGLDFIRRDNQMGYWPTTAGIEIAQAFDARLVGSRHYKKLKAVQGNIVSFEMLEELSSRWRLREASRREKLAFKRAFYPEIIAGVGGDDGRWRAATITLILRSLKMLGRPSTSMDIRKTIARGRTTHGKQLDTSSCENAHCLWAVLQLRQLQRKAHDGLLRWVEIALLEGMSGLASHRPSDLAELAAEQVRNTLDLAPRANLGVLVSRIQGLLNGADFYVSGIKNIGIDIFSLRGELVAQKTEEPAQLVGKCVWALVVCACHADSLSSRDGYKAWLLEGGFRRISLATIADAVKRFHDGSIRDFMHFLIEAYVVAQHFMVAASKMEPGVNKYRFVASDNGLSPLIQPDKIYGLGETGDRLEAALELMADCDMVKRHDDGFIALE